MSARGIARDATSGNDLHPVERLAAEPPRPRGVEVADRPPLAGRRAQDERAQVAQARLDSAVARPQVAATTEDAQLVQPAPEEDLAHPLVTARVVLLVGDLAYAAAVHVHPRRAP